MKRGPKIRFKIVTGSRYGRLTVIGEVEPYIASGIKLRRVECLCDCGNTSFPLWRNVRIGTSSSCGCYGLECRKGHPKTKTHGMSGTPEYRSWAAMRNRCTNPDNKGFKNYGGRGITVCERWMNSFENFYSDMGPRPDGFSIDRIDSDGNYEPSNCRWASMEVQVINRRYFFESAGLAYTPYHPNNYA